MSTKPARGLIALVLRHSGFAGVALAPFGIYILPEDINNVSLVRHEQKHWMQYKEMGLLRYYTTYIYQVVKYGYYNAPMEIEAREYAIHDQRQTRL